MRRRNVRLLLGLAALTVLGAGWWSLTRVRSGPFVVFTPAREECFTGAQAGRDYTVCIYTPVGGHNGGLVYHFHARGLDARSWNERDFYGAQVQALWQAQSALAPRVASVSFGPLWLQMQQTDNSLSGALEVFENAVMKDVEGRLGAPRYRSLLGVSMGGLNVILQALYGRTRFAHAVALCPPVYRVEPRAPLADLLRLVREHGADPRILAGLWWIARSYVQSGADAHVLSPFAQLERVRVDTLPALHVQCGLHDEYGSYRAAQALVERAQARGARAEFRPLYGRHCAIDVTSVADILLRAE